MDFLNRFFAQLRELFGSMTPGARITAGLLLAVVVISLGYLVRNGTSGAGTYLLGGEVFPQHDLQNMELAFGKAGLKDYEIEGGRIRVPHAQQTAFLAALADNNALPRNFAAMEKAIDGSSPFRPKEVQDGAMRVAELKELSQLISLMTGIDWARVMCKTQSVGGLQRHQTTTASVNVKPRGDGPLDDALMRSIRLNVAKALNIDVKDIAVIDQNTGRYITDDPAVSGPGDRMTQVRQENEAEYCRKIREALSYVPGVTVACNVEINPEQSRRQEKVTYDPKPIPVVTTDTSETKSIDGSPVGGRPGYQANAANRPMALDAAAAPGKGSHEEFEKSNTTSTSRVGSEVLQTIVAGLVPKQVTASIVVPAAYFRKLWEKQNPVDPGKQAKTPAAGDLQKIQDETVKTIKATVAKLLPAPADAPDRAKFDLTQLVEVTVFEDFRPQDVLGPDLKDNALSWLAQSWSTLALVVLGFVSLLMLRSMVRSVPAAAPAPRVPVLSARLERGGEAAESEETPAQPKRRFQTGGQSLRDELSELVREDPDAAANILRNWIGNVS